MNKASTLPTLTTGGFCNSTFLLPKTPRRPPPSQNTHTHTHTHTFGGLRPILEGTPSTQTAFSYKGKWLRNPQQPAQQKVNGNPADPMFSTKQTDQKDTCGSFWFPLNPFSLFEVPFKGKCLGTPGRLLGTTFTLNKPKQAPCPTLSNFPPEEHLNPSQRHLPQKKHPELKADHLSRPKRNPRKSDPSIRFSPLPAPAPAARPLHAASSWRRRCAAPGPAPSPSRAATQLGELVGTQELVPGF